MRANDFRGLPPPLRNFVTPKPPPNLSQKRRFGTICRCDDSGSFALRFIFVPPSSHFSSEKRGRLGSYATFFPRSRPEGPFSRSGLGTWPLRPETAKTKGIVSPNETSDFASAAHVIGIIGTRNRRISPDPLFSMGWPPFCFALPAWALPLRRQASASAVAGLPKGLFLHNRNNAAAFPIRQEFVRGNRGGAAQRSLIANGLRSFLDLLAHAGLSGLVSDPAWPFRSRPREYGDRCRRKPCWSPMSIPSPRTAWRGSGKCAATAIRARRPLRSTSGRGRIRLPRAGPGFARTARRGGKCGSCPRAAI